MTSVRTRRPPGSTTGVMSSLSPWVGYLVSIYLHLTSSVPGLNMVSKLYEYLYIEAELRKPTYAENFFLYMFTWFMFFVDTVLIAVVMMTIYLRCSRYRYI